MIIFSKGVLFMKFLVVLPREVLLEAFSNVFWSGHSCYVRGH